MANPVAVAVQGKGFLPMLRRGKVLIGRYSLSPAKIEGELKSLVETLRTHSCAATLPVTAAPLDNHLKLAQMLQDQGMELAVHGLKHVDHTCIPLEILIRDLQQAANIFSKAGIRVAGFRSPYLRWNAGTLAALRTCGFAYDSSQGLAWDVTGDVQTEGYQHVLEFYEAQQAEKYPALPRVEDGLVRIPYCLPDDEALVERLHLVDDQAMADLWLEMLDRVYQAGELFTLGLHPERAHFCQKALRAVLEKARSLSPSIWIARLNEIATWHRELGETAFEAYDETSDRLRVRIHKPSRGTVLVRSLKLDAPVETWASGYHKVLANEFTVFCNKRPWIGLSPDCPPSLKSFLQYQGYLVEISAETKNFAFYLRPTRFRPEDERPLLGEIERGDWPIMRLSRWPGGAKAALAITGDVDAFTLWDYGRRFFNA